MQIRSCFGVAAIGALILAASGCAKKPEAEKGPIAPGPHVVEFGDDLTGIALRAYGDMNLWHSLLNANPALVKRSRFHLVIGETIDVPAKDKLDKKLPKPQYPKQLPANYIIMPGDSLLTIAEGCYGDREKWPLIYEANRKKLSERVKQDPKQILAGEVLRIPTKEGKAWVARKKPAKKKKLTDKSTATAAVENGK